MRLRLKWFKDLRHSLRLLIWTGLLIIILVLYIPFAKYISSTILSCLSLPLEFCQDVSVNAKQFLRFQDLVAENKKLNSRIEELTSELAQLQEAALENLRLRGLLSLPQRQSFKTEVALVLGQDSSNWTKVVLLNKGTQAGLEVGMPAVSGGNLVGQVIEACSQTSKVRLITDFNSKVAARILRTREQGVVWGTFEKGQSLCKLKYIHQAEEGDKVVSSGLAGIYPKGLLIGEITAASSAAEEDQNQLYQIVEIQPAVDFLILEEVCVITGQ